MRPQVHACQSSKPQLYPSHHGNYCPPTCLRRRQPKQQTRGLQSCKLARSLVKPGRRSGAVHSTARRARPLGEPSLRLRELSIMSTNVPPPRFLRFGNAPKPPPPASRHHWPSRAYCDRCVANPILLHARTKPSSTKSLESW